MLVFAMLAGCGSDEQPAATASPQSRSESQAATIAPQPSPGCVNPDTSFALTGQNGSLESGGEQRVFSLEVPPDDSIAPLPLVVNMHGALGNRVQQASSSRFGELGQREGFVVVSPQARGERPIWSLREQGPDLAYVEELIDEVLSRLCIDTGRVYLTGFSMGGMMSMVLACRHPERYAAIAPVAGAMEIRGCDRAVPVPMLALHGTADRLVRFDGSYDESLGPLLGTTKGPTREEVAASWADDNGCGDADEVTIEPDVEHVTYACDRSGSVEFYIVDGGGHSWPGSEPDPVFRGNAETITQTVDATEVIWRFFSEHARTPSATS
jgi:polyhydroxybutyrate depolymerase